MQEIAKLKEMQDCVDPVLLEATRSLKDRQFILGIEQDCHRCLSTEYLNNCHLTCSPMIEYQHLNSYLRLLVHKVGHHYNLGHQWDAHRQCLVLYRLEGSRMYAFWEISLLL